MIGIPKPMTKSVMIALRFSWRVIVTELTDAIWYNRRMMHRELAGMATLTATVMRVANFER
jgi:hypothetical protein